MEILSSIFMERSVIQDDKLKEILFEVSCSLTKKLIKEGATPRDMGFLILLRQENDGWHRTSSMSSEVVGAWVMEWLEDFFKNNSIKEEVRKVV